SARIGVGFKHQLQVKGALPRHWQLSGRSVWTYAFPSWIVPAVTTPEQVKLTIKKTAKREIIRDPIIGSDLGMIRKSYFFLYINDAIEIRMNRTFISRPWANNRKGKRIRDL
ncbi:MAG: hypothetical protein WCJ93_09940, partial [Methanomicrobiales archaeon]